MIFIVAHFCFLASAQFIRVYVIVNTDSAPVEILEFGQYLSEKPDHISSVVKYENRTDRDIEALAIIMIYYDAFNDKQDGTIGISTPLLKAHRRDSGLWSIYGKPDFVKTAMTFVSAVRFLDGEVWKAEIDEVIKTAG